MSSSKRLVSHGEDSTSSKRQRSNVDLRSKAERLRRWFTDASNGGWLNLDFTIGSDQFRGFHARAATDLSSPFVAATCPLALTLSYLSLDRDQTLVRHCDSPLQGLLGKVPHHVLSYLFLIEQRLLGDDSLWSPYIDCLPSEHDMTTPLWFEPEDFAGLIGTNLPAAAQARLEKLDRELQQAHDVMTTLGWSEEQKQQYNQTQFKWAATIFSSRAFISDHILPALPTFPILFPVVDILNHSLQAKVQWDFTPREAFSLRIEENIRAGEEIFNNYAPKPNDELLMGYGFCIPGNPIDQANIRVAAPPGAVDPSWFRADLVPFDMSTDFLKDSDIANKPQYLRTRGHKLGCYQNTIPALRGFPPYVVFITYAMYIDQWGADPSSLPLPNPGGRVVVAVLRLLYAAVSARCTALPLQLPKTHAANEKQRYAKIYRDGQARIVHTIRSEVYAALASILSSSTLGSTRAPPAEQPCIVTLADAEQLLEHEFPAFHKQYATGSERLRQSTTNGMRDKVLWMHLLITFVAITLDSTDCLIYEWLEDLVATYPLPDELDPDAPQDDSDPAFLLSRTLAENYKDNPATDSLWSRIANLSTISTLHRSSDNEIVNAYADAEDFRGKIIEWAVGVVEREVFVLPDADGATRTCLYVRPSSASMEDEKWMLEEVEVPSFQELMERELQRGPRS